MNVTILTYVEEGVTDAAASDPVIGQVADALRQNGHEPRVLGAHGDARALLGSLFAGRPGLVFNLMEMFETNVFGDVGVAGLLELTGIPFTGGGAGDLYLAQNKALTKKLLAFEGIAYPRFAVFGRDSDLEVGGKLRMPLFVKPLRMDASIGIDAKGLVHDARALFKRVALIHDECKDAALAEEYIDGREFYVGVLANVANGEPRALPPMEMDFTGLPAGTPRVLDRKAKWDVDTPEYKGTRAELAKVPAELAARLCEVAASAYRALQVRDYGRVDLRMTDAGDIYVLEVNASCYLEKTGEFAVSAAAAGLSYAEVIEAICESACKRHEVARASMLPRASRTSMMEVP